MCQGNFLFILFLKFTKNCVHATHLRLISPTLFDYHYMNNYLTISFHQIVYKHNCKFRIVVQNTEHIRSQFHQQSAYSFCARRSQKNTVKSSVSFYAFGIYKHKSCTKNGDEIEP